MDVSERDLCASVENILRGANLADMTLRKCMAELAKTYEVEVEELRPRKKLVRKTIEEYLANMPAEEEEDDAEESSAEAVETKPKAKRRRPAAEASDDDGDDLGWRPVTLSGLSKAVVLSPQLGDLLGVRVMGRSAIQKAIIDYVKDNKLQDESDKRSIIADASLKRAFKVNKFTFFGLSKLISEHVEKVDTCGDETLIEEARKCDEETLARLKAERAEKIANGEKPPSSKRKKPAKKSGQGTRRSAR